MRLRLVLLHSASALATAAAVGGAQAADAFAPYLVDDTVVPPDGYTFSVQGGFLFSHSDSDLDELAALGSGFDVDDVELTDFLGDLGYNAAFSIGKTFDDGWDVTFGASINKLVENSGSFSGGFSYGYTSYGYSGFYSGYHSAGFAEGAEHQSFGFETLDFEVG